MSTSVLEHPPDRLSASDAPDCDCDETGSAPSIPVKKSFDQLITPDIASNKRFVRRVVTDLVQSCIHRAEVDLEQECVHWEREIPSDIATSLGIARDSCNAINMADALLKMINLDERRKVLCMMADAIVRLS